MVCYLVLYLALTYSSLSFGLWIFALQLTEKQLSYLMSVNNSKVLLDNILFETDRLHFYDLPKRKIALFSEITSANRDTSYPLAPDFSFHLEYTSNGVKIFEDHGSGCVFRIYLFPILPRDANALHRMKNSDLKDMFIVFDFDGKSQKFTLEAMARAISWPFVFPASTTHSKISSGLSSYLPLCYRNYAKITYVHHSDIPPNLLNITVDCTKNDLQCPTHIYSAVSRLKFANSRRLIDDDSLLAASTSHKRQSVEKAAKILLKPELSGPNKDTACSLQCITLCPHCKNEIYSSQTTGVISTIYMRAFNSHGELLSSWDTILLSMRFDQTRRIQVDRIPLGWLFGATASLNDFRGAAAGHRQKHCSYAERTSEYQGTLMTGYSYFAMPYWHSARIWLEGTEFIDQDVTVCYQIITVTNYYDPTTTGHFYMNAAYFGGDVSGWRNVLTVNGSWGHIVGLYTNVDNLRYVRGADVNERWAMLQADFDLFVDGMRSASMLGTGLEDYFSYSHGFTFAENTTYSFVGVYHTSPRRKEPLTFHCYRFQVLDPIPFQNSVLFISEGTSAATFRQPTPALSYEDHRRLLNRDETLVSYLIIYYAGQSAGLKLCDKLTLGDTESANAHNMKVTSNTGRSVLDLKNVRYIGAKTLDETFAGTACVMTSKDSLKFMLSLSVPNQGAVLRRNFYTPPYKWNETASVMINGHDCGIWFIPMGSLVQEYSLREDDFLIDASVTQTPHVNIVITPFTNWIDISYELFAILPSAEHV